MGECQSAPDKKLDQSVPGHILSMFRKSQYAGMECPRSSDSDDYRYGPCEFLEPDFTSKIVKKRLKLKDERQFQVYLSNKEQRKTFDPKDFVRLLDYDCGNLSIEESENYTYKYFIDCYFEHHPDDLRSNIKDRRSSGIQYSDSEMKQFQNFFLRAGAFLDGLKNRHGDLRPEFVCLDGVGNPLLIENLRDRPGTGAKLAFATESILYCSPIQFKSYCINVAKPKNEKAKDDVFAAGLILLEMGLLDSVQKIYNKEEGQVDANLLAETLENFEQRYSAVPDVVENLRRMLVVEEESRPTFKELLEKASRPQDSQQRNQAYGYQPTHQQQIVHNYNQPQYPTGYNFMQSSGFSNFNSNSKGSSNPLMGGLAGNQFGASPQPQFSSQQNHYPQTNSLAGAYQYNIGNGNPNNGIGGNQQFAGFIR